MLVVGAVEMLPGAKKDMALAVQLRWGYIYFKMAEPWVSKTGGLLGTWERRGRLP